MMSAGDMGVLILERDQLVRERDQLVRERDQLVQEKPQLAKEKKKLQASNSRLIEDKKTLNQTVIEQQNQIKELEMQQNASRCPQGWWTFMSTCYQLSSMPNTWKNAKQDCASKGSHLVILNDKLEERIVLSLGGTGRMWMGLHGVRVAAYSWDWTLVDGSTLFYTNWNRWYPEIEGYSGCAYVKQADTSSVETWFVGTCRERYYWICEKELHTRSIRPK
ncbi:C-type lectin domain family 4 member G-like [Sebastes umbrosus]|uniref:C-type lectin domain family 4 member G-like n=1 Tax=Sebastes umbrosus TaxID=72105 RepID=UPI00189D34D8|nr:C-type lectin domain family 4 member G-like [Sebastes umbrosus]